jgi:hypothetical protein
MRSTTILALFLGTAAGAAIPQRLATDASPNTKTTFPDEVSTDPLDSYWKSYSSHINRRCMPEDCPDLLDPSTPFFPYTSDTKPRSLNCGVDPGMSPCPGSTLTQRQDGEVVPQHCTMKYDCAKACGKEFKGWACQMKCGGDATLPLCPEAKALMESRWVPQ